MGVEVTVIKTEAHQVVTQQGEVERFFLRNSHPVTVKLLGHAGKTPNNVERQVDGVQLDMRQCVQECGAPLYSGEGQFFDRRWQDEGRLRWATGYAARWGDVRLRVDGEIKTQGEGAFGFGKRILSQQGANDGSAQGSHFQINRINRHRKKKNPKQTSYLGFNFGGSGEIRTHETLRFASFQD